MLRGLLNRYRLWRRRRALARKKKELQLAIDQLTTSFQLFAATFNHNIVTALTDFADAYTKAVERANHPFYLQDNHAGKDGKYKGGPHE